ncbi:WG repeat-containing protein, partial [Campylobacter coli]
AVWGFSEGLVAVKLNGKWGFIDKSGKIVIESKFDSGGHFSEGLAGVKLNGKYGLIDKSGKIVIEPIFDDIDY